MNNELCKAIVRLGYDAILLRAALDQADKQRDLSRCSVDAAVSAAFILNEAAAAICEAITRISNAATRPMAQTPPELLAELERNVVPFKKPKTGNP